MNPFIVILLALLLYGGHLAAMHSPRYRRWHLRRRDTRRALTAYLDRVERP